MFAVHRGQFVHRKTLQRALAVGRWQQFQFAGFGGEQPAGVQDVFTGQVVTGQRVGRVQQPGEHLDGQARQIQKGRAGLHHVIVQRLDGPEPDAQLAQAPVAHTHGRGQFAERQVPLVRTLREGGDQQTTRARELVRVETSAPGNGSEFDRLFPEHRCRVAGGGLLHGVWGLS
ncbi:hypothetical protein FQZ97_933950 [compost metagenome]